MPEPPNRNWGAQVNLCSAVSYFSTRMGSIIGAGRLSFRVRDGTGRFPAAMDRRNSILLCGDPHESKLVGLFWWWGDRFDHPWSVVASAVRQCFLLTTIMGCCKFSAG